MYLRLTRSVWKSVRFNPIDVTSVLPMQVRYLGKMAGVSALFMEGKLICDMVVSHGEFSCL